MKKVNVGLISPQLSKWNRET